MARPNHMDPECERGGCQEAQGVGAEASCDRRCVYLWRPLLEARVHFWACPVQHPEGQHVEWVGDLARCLVEGCGKTNQDDAISESAKRPCGDRKPHEAHHWVEQIAVDEGIDRWCSGTPSGPASTSRATQATAGWTCDP